MDTQITKFGTSGRPIAIKTNMFQILSIPKKTFYHYHVITHIGPDGAPKEVKTPLRMREIVDKLQVDNNTIFNHPACYDGAKNLYSTLQLKQENFTVRMSKDPNSNRGLFNVVIKRVNTIRHSDLERLMTVDALSNPAAAAVAVNLLQVIVSQAPNIKHHFALHSKSFYFQSNKFAKLSGGLEAWRGFFQSVRPVLNRIVINVDTTTAAIYAPGNLLDRAMECLNDPSRNLPNSRNVRDFVRLCQEDKSALKRISTFYKGIYVTVPGRKREAKIEEIIPEAGFVKFPKGDTGMSTVVDHFQQHHRITLQFPGAFGVRIGKTAVYPAEVCTVFPGQVYKKKLDPRDTAEFLKTSTLKPDIRMREIQDAVDRDILGYQNSSYMRDAEMTVEPRPIQISGRVIRPPSVVYGNQQVDVRDGAWNVMRKQFKRPAEIYAWAVVTFHHERGRDTTPIAQDLAQKLRQNMKVLGMAFHADPHFHIGNDADPDKSLTAAADAAVAKANTKKLSFILVILPSNAAPLRKIVKQWGDMKYGIPTQCVRAGKYENARDQYCNNVALKINAKIGGINSVIDFFGLGFLKTCMVIGCDVAHPSPGAVSRPSVASLVASVDECATRYHTEIRVQPPRQESIDSIGPMVQNALIQFKNRNAQFPNTILVYRDGVSEGEYTQVEDTEIKQIQDLLDDMHRRFQHKAKLIFIVVGKRHHVRFFPTNQQDADRTGNLSAGLVVDREVIHSKYMDFYLQSQAGLLGTSRPSHYIVLKNDVGLSADQLQEISFALCHVYASATRSVSIPAPVYYADRLCARADFQFRTKHLDSDDGSSAHAAQFDLKAWKDDLGQSKLHQQMYFL